MGKRIYSSAVIILCCIMLTSCHSSLTEMKIPTGPFPPVDYSAMFEGYEMKETPLEYGQISSQFPLFNMEEESSVLSSAELYDCGVIGYDKTDRLVYYYFILLAPKSGDTYSYNIYVKTCHIDNGNQFSFYSSSDDVKVKVDTVGGDEFEEGAEQLTTQYNPGDTEFKPTVSIIGTPASDTFEYEIAATPTFFAKLMDTGDLFVYFKKIGELEGKYDFYSYSSSGGVTWQTGGPDYNGLYPDWENKKANYTNRGWSVELADVTPVIFSPEERHKVGGTAYDHLAVTEIFYVYSFVPPAKETEENTEAPPVAPDLDMSESEMEITDEEFSDEEASSELYKEGQPFYVTLLFRRDDLAKVKFVSDLAWYDLDRMKDEWSFTDNKRVTMFEPINHSNYKAGDKELELLFNISSKKKKDQDKLRESNTGIGYWIPSVTIIPVGDSSNYGYTLICTPRNIVFYDGQTGAYSKAETKLSDYDRRVFNESDTFGVSDSEALWAEYMGALPFSQSGTVKKLCLRSNDSAARYINTTMGRAATNEKYKQYKALESSPAPKEILEGLSIIIGGIVDAVNRDNFPENRRKEMDQFAKNNFFAPLSVDADSSWDFAAQLLSQRKVPGYSDLDFFSARNMVMHENSGYEFSQVGSPSWQIKSGNMGVLSDPPGTSTVKPSKVAAYVTRESGLDIYGVIEQSGLVKVNFKDYDDGGKDKTAEYKGTYLVHGYHLDGAFYNIWHLGESKNTYLLVGFAEPNRMVSELDMAEAMIMTASVGTKDTAEQNWIKLP